MGNYYDFVVIIFFLMMSDIFEIRLNMIMDNFIRFCLVSCIGFNNSICQFMIGNFCGYYVFIIFKS